MARFKARFSEVDAIKVKIVEPGEQEGTAGYLVGGKFVGESTFETFCEAIKPVDLLNGAGLSKNLYKGPTRKHKPKKRPKPKPAAPLISPADRLKRVEDLVLEVLANGECDSGVIIEYVQARKPTTAPQTIHTQLQRMKNEGVIDLHRATGTMPRLWFKTA